MAHQIVSLWHLLSLDAPSVATLWAWGFAHAFHLTLSPYSLPLLFAGTWLIYVADRILDGFHSDRTRLRERHLFYIRHRTVIAVAAIPVSIVLAWLVLFHMLPGARRADGLIFAIAAAYFALVHMRGRAIERWFPKELIVALVFAAATAVPAFSRLAPNSAQNPAQDKTLLVLMSLLFAALCWLNCIAIEKWEQPSGGTLNMPVNSPWSQGSQAQISDRTTRWGQRHLCSVSAVLAAAAALLATALLYRTNPLAAGLCFAAAAAAALFIPLDSSPFSAFHLRIAADAALLTPLLLLLVR
jgi:hypothetical protein